MFSKEQIDEYRRLRVPDSLKQKIAASAPVQNSEKFRFSKTTCFLGSGVIMALLLLVFILTAPLRSVGIHISFDGIPITEEPLVLSASPVPSLHSDLRNTSVCLSIPITLQRSGMERSQTMDVSVSHGELFYLDSSSDRMISVGTEYPANDNQIFYWQIETLSSSDTYTMTIREGRRQQTVILFFDKTSGWSLRQTKSN